MPECAACGATVAEGERTCPECGADVAGATAQFRVVEVETPEAAGATGQAVEGPALYVRKGPESGGTFYLDRDRLTVGRDPASDIFLNDVTVSRTHAVIEATSEGETVSDSGSLNGTYVNGEIVERAVLRDGDVLQIGTFQMVFCSPGGHS